MNQQLKIISSLFLTSVLASCASSNDHPFGSSNTTSSTNIISAGFLSVGFSTPAPAVFTLTASPAAGATTTPCTNLTAVSGSETSTITVTAADNSNAAVSGITVYIDVEWGNLDNNSCELQNGTCTVEWSSSTNFDVLTTGLDGTDCLFNGTSTQTLDIYNAVTVWTYGEEYFQDNDGDNQLSDSEIFVDINEPFLDRNDNGTYQSPPDDLTSADTNGSHDAADGMFNGPSCDTSTRSDCAGPTLIPIYESSFMILGQ